MADTKKQRKLREKLPKKCQRCGDPFSDLAPRIAFVALYDRLYDGSIYAHKICAYPGEKTAEQAQHEQEEQSRKEEGALPPGVIMIVYTRF